MRCTLQVGQKQSAFEVCIRSVLPLAVTWTGTSAPVLLQGVQNLDQSIMSTSDLKVPQALNQRSRWKRTKTPAAPDGIASYFQSHSDSVPEMIIIQSRHFESSRKTLHLLQHSFIHLGGGVKCSDWLLLISHSLLPVLLRHPNLKLNPSKPQGSTFWQEVAAAKRRLTH